MLAAERQSHILLRSQALGVVRTRVLAKELGVVEETIRRDLDKLAELGALVRVHGGAAVNDFGHRDLAYEEREVSQQKEKVAIARCAAQAIKVGETILFDASSTCLQMAKLIPPNLRVRVVTYSLPIFEIFKDRKQVDLVLLGGDYESRGRRFGGPLTEEGLLSCRIDRFFFSAKGFDTTKGASEANEEQARLKTVGLIRSSWGALLVDGTKLGSDSSYHFAQTHELSAVFTDELGGEYFERAPLRESRKVTIAD
ncbi:DeoR/GlpR family DNA-binding transcription regulator [Roseibacillus persicicus]|uniref:HTH-type transcriptional regulator YulB n=1 Tax=Roseibacillus persicicus TaxID=454148 RepID=A0A918TNW5_9BACT|nr:DeoR/GlpR family DNA-binding transcription regulator [Roseibacillus persicicus]GHC53234.1 putative HTH-type transcriptional regulator YulB [Roseibacillus persicicus]